MTPRILALDCATKTGYACRYNGGLDSGTAEFKVKRGDSPGMRFYEFRTWLVAMVSELKPEIVVYEEPHHHGWASTELLVGFTTRVQEVAAAAGCDYRAVHSNTLKLWATGNGKADKSQMEPAARNLFPDVQFVDDNHVDALLLLAYAEAGFPDAGAARREAQRLEKERQAQLALEERAALDRRIVELLRDNGATDRLPKQAVQLLAADLGVSEGRVRSAWTGQRRGKAVA